MTAPQHIEGLGDYLLLPHALERTVQAYGDRPALEFLGKVISYRELGRRVDAAARGLVAEEARLLGVGFTNLLHLFSPDVLIVGGGMGLEWN